MSYTSKCKIQSVRVQQHDLEYQKTLVLAFTKLELQITLFSYSIELCDYVRSDDSRKRQEVFRNQKGNLLSKGKAYQSCALWMGSEFPENCYQTTSLLGKMGSGHEGTIIYTLVVHSYICTKYASNMKKNNGPYTKDNLLRVEFVSFG